jgi:hypothetical protein
LKNKIQTPPTLLIKLKPINRTDPEFFRGSALHHQKIKFSHWMYVNSDFKNLQEEQQTMGQPEQQGPHINCLGQILSLRWQTNYE